MFSGVKNPLSIPAPRFVLEEVLKRIEGNVSFPWDGWNTNPQPHFEGENEDIPVCEKKQLTAQTTRDLAVKGSSIYSLKALLYMASKNDGISSYEQSIEHFSFLIMSSFLYSFWGYFVSHSHEPNTLSTLLWIRGLTIAARKVSQCGDMA